MEEEEEEEVEEDVEEEEVKEGEVAEMVVDAAVSFSTLRGILALLNLFASRLIVGTAMGMMAWLDSGRGRDNKLMAA